MIRKLMSLIRYRPRGREIFRYRVGKSYRYADPIDIALILADHPTYLPRHLAEARAGDLESIEICGQVACDAFGVTFADNDEKLGLTRAELVKLLMSFDLWKIAIKHKHDAFCRLAAIHGCNVAGIDAERFCALYFTRNESEIRIANNARLAIRTANAELPLGWFMATRDTRDEAQNAHDLHLSSIAAARAAGAR